MTTPWNKNDTGNKKKIADLRLRIGRAIRNLKSAIFNRSVSPGAGPKPGPRSDTSSTAKHSPEWPTQKPLGPASWLPLPRRAGSAGFPQTRHAAELGLSVRYGSPFGGPPVGLFV